MKLHGMSFRAEDLGYSRVPAINDNKYEVRAHSE
jgi:hypothetical protein